MTLQRVQPQHFINVADVEASSRWYQQVLGGTSVHGGQEYDRIEADGLLVLQLHAADVDHHHGHNQDTGAPVGNGVLIWFEVDDFDLAAARAKALDAPVVHDVHINPNAGQRELWVRDLDGYVVVLASHTGDAATV